MSVNSVVMMATMMIETIRISCLQVCLHTPHGLAGDVMFVVLYDSHLPCPERVIVASHA